MIAHDQYNDASPKKEGLVLMVDYKRNDIQVKTLVDTPAGTMKLFAFDHGTKLKEHMAPHDVQLLILEGVAEVTIEGQIFHVRAGEPISIPAKRVHAVEAKTPFKMLLMRWAFLL